MSDKKFNKIEYNNQFISKSYDRINLTVPKGKKTLIKTYAEKSGKSVNSFINEAIDEKVSKVMDKECLST